MPLEFPFLDRILADDPLLAASLGITEETAARPLPERLLAPAQIDRPAFRWRSRLDGVFYGLRMIWNQSERRWWIDLESAEGDLLVTGIPIVEGTDLLGPFHGRAGVPPGDLYVEDTQGAGQEPERFDFLGRSRLIYHGQGDRPALERIARAALTLEPPASPAAACVDPEVTDWFIYLPPYVPSGGPNGLNIPQGSTFPSPTRDFAAEGTDIDENTVITVAPTGQGVTLDDLFWDAVESRWRFKITATPGSTLGNYTITFTNPPDCASDEATFVVISGS